MTLVVSPKARRIQQKKKKKKEKEEMPAPEKGKGSRQQRYLRLRHKEARGEAGGVRGRSAIHSKNVRKRREREPGDAQPAGKLRK